MLFLMLFVAWKIVLNIGMDPDPEPNFSKVGTGINSRGSKFQAYFFDFFVREQTIIQSLS